jgi:hypothetical protein
MQGLIDPVFLAFHATEASFKIGGEQTYIPYKVKRSQSSGVYTLHSTNGMVTLLREGNCVTNSAIRCLLSTGSNS